MRSDEPHGTVPGLQEPGTESPVPMTETGGSADAEDKAVVLRVNPPRARAVMRHGRLPPMRPREPQGAVRRLEKPQHDPVQEPVGRRVSSPHPVPEADGGPVRVEPHRSVGRLDPAGQAVRVGVDGGPTLRVEPKRFASEKRPDPDRAVPHLAAHQVAAQMRRLGICVRLPPFALKTAEHSRHSNGPQGAIRGLPEGQAKSCFGQAVTGCVGPPPVAVKAADPTTRAAEPERAVAGLQNTRNNISRQPVFGRVMGPVFSVKSVDAAAMGREPERAVGGLADGRNTGPGHVPGHFDCGPGFSIKTGDASRRLRPRGQESGP